MGIYSNICNRIPNRNHFKLYKHKLAIHWFLVTGIALQNLSVWTY